MDIEEYIKNRHRKNSRVNLEEDKKIKYLRGLITRVLLSIILIISISIFIKLDDKNVLLVDKYLFDNSLKFTKINNWYQDNIGSIIPNPTDNSELVFSNNDISSKHKEKYLDGVKITVDKNSLITALCGGIVVFIGDKEGYGNTLIIQGNDGIDYWYGGITNTSVNLYDYIEKDTLLGEALEEYMYIVLQKDGNYLNYEDIL